MNEYLPNKKKRPVWPVAISGLFIVAGICWLGISGPDGMEELLQESMTAETTPGTSAGIQEQEPGISPETTQTSESGLEKSGPATAQETPEPVIYTAPDFTEWVIKKNSTVYTTLRQAGVSPGDIHAIVTASKSTYNLAKIHAGVLLKVHKREVPEKELSEFYKVSFALSLTDTLFLEKNPEGNWGARIHSKPVTIVAEGYQGTIRSSLWLSATSAGLDSVPVYALTDIMAWQIDFDREVQPGDHWRLLVERKYVEGTPVGWGSIIIAEYQRGTEQYTAIRYPRTGEHFEYYSPIGDNMKGRFLKSPLRYSRISSGFQLKRFHPVLGINRPHYGVDYAAPTGTPVRAVGDGTITILGRRGGNGKMIRIRHNSAYETAYKHLSRYGKGLRRGSKVKQGDVIAYVGSTGLATGPHLHFEFYENGKFTDPLGRKFPREDPVPPDSMSEFKEWATQSQKKLDELQPRNLKQASAGDTKPGL